MPWWIRWWFVFWYPNVCWKHKQFKHIFSDDTHSLTCKLERREKNRLKSNASSQRNEMLRTKYGVKV